ncbi:MAG TPA: stage V sporulation protein AC [Clostridiales bacterium]|nr:stage V sporulation protein AC [Clostridiales bacterium]
MTSKKQNNFVNQKFLDYVSATEPKTKEWRTLFNAFMIGGFICCIGQFIRFCFIFWFGLAGDELAGSTSMVMIFLGTFLTALGVYDKIAKYAGAGTIVPITGFANSVCSPAIDFRSEGFIYGMAAKMFVIAGPIIVFGVSSSVLVGLIYYFFSL